MPSAHTVRRSTWDTEITLPLMPLKHLEQDAPQEDSDRRRRRNSVTFIRKLMSMTSREPRLGSVLNHHPRSTNSLKTSLNPLLSEVGTLHQTLEFLQTRAHKTVLKQYKLIFSTDQDQ
jgi:hypothetical protein